jgi:drug/metabolite transporter (DMT)-like permease
MLPERIIGIVLAMTAMSLFNLSPLLQKSALNRIPRLSFRTWWTSFRHMLSDRRWIAGFLVGCLGLVPYFIALDLVGVAVVQPLYGFGFIVLVAVSHRMLDERLHPAAWAGIGLLVLMPLFIALGDVSNVQADVTGTRTLLRLLVFVTASGALSFLISLQTKRHPTAYAFVSGIYYGLAALFMQGAASLFTLLTHWGWNRPAALLAAALMISIPANIFADYCLQIGLQRRNASRFTPISQTVNNAVAVAGGLFIFGQQVGRWDYYLTALLLGAAGLFLLTGFEHAADRPKFKSG